jgi:transglutaminase-like putative cysteine protease
MRVRVGCEFQYEALSAVPAVMLVRARPDGTHRIVYESRWVDPPLAIREYRDTFGNICWRLTFPEGITTLRYDAVVDVDDEPDPTHPGTPLTPVAELPDEALEFTLASRYVESDLLANVAWPLFGSTPQSWERVQAVCDWIHANIAYKSGSSSPEVSALTVYERRVGVCRDFALLAVAFCRALNIPARYTFGYLPDITVGQLEGAMDFHAWFEAFIGGRWHTFDARHNVPRIGRVVIGYGRDAADVAMTTSYGALRLERMTVWADEVHGTLADDGLVPPPAALSAPGAESRDR